MCGHDPGNAAYVADALDVDARSTCLVGAGFAGLYLLYRRARWGCPHAFMKRATASAAPGTGIATRAHVATPRASRIRFRFRPNSKRMELVGALRDATGDPPLRGTRSRQIRSEARHPLRTPRHRGAPTTMPRTWTVETDRGDRAVAPFCVMATGCLSVPQEPQIPGLDEFAATSTTRACGRTDRWISPASASA